MILNSYSSTSVYMHLQYLLYRRYLIKVRASLIKGTMESPRGAQTRLGSRLASLHAQETPRAHIAAHAIFPGQIASADAVRWSGAPRRRCP